MLHRLLHRSEKTHRPASTPAVVVEGLESRCLMSVVPTGLEFSAVEGSHFQGTLATFTTTDKAPLSADNYTATVDWGDGHSTLARVKADPLGAGAFLVVGRHRYTEDGSYDVKVMIHDAVDKTDATAKGEAHVKDALLNANSKTIDALAGKKFTRMVAIFHDFNRFASASDFTITINWGDGSASVGTVAADGRGTFKVMGTHSYAAKGSFDITVTIVDAGGSSATVLSTAKVK